jgi:osmotically-inducible protein OsmY
LYWDQSVDASNITVAVSNGRVTLRGAVKTYRSLRAACNDALIIPGVKEITNEISVELPSELQSINDEQLKARVENILTWNADVDTREIQITVEDGKVTIEGHVNFLWNKENVEKLVSSVAGVKEIENALTVIPTKSYRDSAIADGIMSALKRQGTMDVNQLDITVEDGIVTISGKVPNWAVLEDINSIINYSMGVRDVFNELQVLDT